MKQKTRICALAFSAFLHIISFPLHAFSESTTIHAALKTIADTATACPRAYKLQQTESLQELIVIGLQILEENPTIFTPEETEQLTHILVKNYPEQNNTFFMGDPSASIIGTDLYASANIILPLTTGTGGQIQQPGGTPLVHTFGTNNFFAGSMAGTLTNTTSNNTAIGAGAGRGVSTNDNTSVGYNAHAYGGGSTALGDATTATGAHSIAIGYGSEAIGNDAIAIGLGNATTNQIRIGFDSSNAANQTSCFIDGITGATVGESSTVLINTSGQLGIITSSKRYKKDIEDMGAQSSNIMKLRPVTFKYKEQNNQNLQYGLIAEEVAEIYPDLVVYKNGEPETVMYHQLPNLMLNELRKHEATINMLLTRLEQHEKTINDLLACVAVLRMG